MEGFSFSTANVEQRTQRKRDFVGYGVQEVEVVGVKASPVQGNSKRRELVFSFKPSHIETEYDANGNLKGGRNVRMNMTVGSQLSERIFYSQLLDLGQALRTRKEIDEATTSASSMEEVGKNLSNLFSGRQCRIMLGAEEYINSNGEKKVAVKFILSNEKYQFTEATQEGCEKSVVSESESRLKFDKTSDFHYKTCPDPDVEEESSETAQPSWV